METSLEPKENNIMARQSSDPDKGDRAPFLSGGKHAMQGRVGVGAQKPGVSSQEGRAALSGGPGKPTAGPPGAGFYSPATTNKDYAGTQAPGISGATKSGGNSKFAEGGKNAMFGNTGSRPARGGRSSAG
jgi:hypothetical protein